MFKRIQQSHSSLRYVLKALLPVKCHFLHNKRRGKTCGTSCQVYVNGCVQFHVFALHEGIVNQAADKIKGTRNNFD